MIKEIKIDIRSSMGDAFGVEVLFNYQERCIVADASKLGEIRFDQWITLGIGDKAYDFMYDCDASDASVGEHIFDGKIAGKYWQFVIVSE